MSEPTLRELIRALRHCAKNRACEDCLYFHRGADMLETGCIDAIMTDAADRLGTVADHLEAAGDTKSMEG